MGMMSYVVGIRKPDDKWKKYKKIIDALEESGLTWEDAPKDVKEFFGWDRPDPDGISITLASKYGNDNHECCQLHEEEMEDGFVIDISKLPKNITHIKFLNSY